MNIEPAYRKAGKEQGISNIEVPHFNIHDSLFTIQSSENNRTQLFGEFNFHLLQVLVCLYQHQLVLG